MISYFVRRQLSGAFISPERYSEKQQKWNWQVNLSYLLDLDWKIPHEFQKNKLRETDLKELKKVAKGGTLNKIIGTVAELRSELTTAERKAKKLRHELENFNVLPSYNKLADKAANAKFEMQKITRETVSIQQTIDHLESSIKSETPPDSDMLIEMYSSAEIEIPDIALKRLEDVRLFQESIIKNRKHHLEREIKRLKEIVEKNKHNAGIYDSNRQIILKELKNRGALEDFVFLQKELSEIESKAATIRERYKAAIKLESEITQIDIERGNLLRRLQQDYQERDEILNEVINLVTYLISEFYDDRNGKFEIAATDKGPDFKISIEGDQGGGIASMEIFCLDFTIFQLNLKKKRGPGFLFHDSHLFDGVDERQITQALSLGSKATQGLGFQYIVTMNSDIFNKLPQSDNFDPESAKLSSVLSDETDSGGLFGFRFD